MNRQRIVEVARSFVGVPFRWQGRDRAGVDCAGLCHAVSAELGCTLPSPNNYRRPLPAGFLLAQLQRHLRERAPAPVQRGCGDGVSACCPDCRNDLVGAVIYLGRLGQQHCAICTGTTVISADDRVGRVVEVDYVARVARAVTRVFDFPVGT